MPGRSFWTSWRGLALFLLLAVGVSYAMRHGGPPLTDLSGDAALAGILADHASPSEGPADGDVTLVVYTDYRCPVCRGDARALERLASREKRVRILYKDWPILTPESRVAARLALAAAYQGRYGEVHRALMAASRLDEPGLRQALGEAGADWDRAQADLALHSEAIDMLLAEHAREAAALRLPGTPGYLANQFLGIGAMGDGGFSRIVSRARGAL
ncbi:DsbA family protein [Sphingomonas quercus]|uniref:DsbA family protein n=1 Tax=Sphingomonas quercus TaxID=2842451 RepID=A0ABS6BG76_9SPHN|nr:DsbA family protein [Sphingomonas quercus]MBU3077295.1 DsbA family protein [Sphingomonas quercus]